MEKTESKGKEKKLKKKDFLYEEPLMPNYPKMQTSPSGKYMVELEKAYDTAARAFARSIYECACRHPTEFDKVYDLLKASYDWRLNPKHSWTKEGQDFLFSAMNLFEKTVADKEYKVLSDKLGPSGFQAGWAFQVVREIWEEERGRGKNGN